MQAKKSGGSADTQGAERILMANKPVVSGSLIIIRLVSDQENGKNIWQYEELLEQCN